jgi:hypothetical protein
LKGIKLIKTFHDYHRGPIMLLRRPWVLSQPTTDAEMEGITDEIRETPHTVE